MTKPNKADPSPSEGQPTPQNPAPVQSESTDSTSLPPLTPLDTKTPVQFNQQVNFNQPIPVTAWNTLSAEQMVDLSKHIITTANISDERRFTYAMDRAEKQNTKDKLSHGIGGAIACVGMIGLTYLAMNGHELIALSLS